MKSTTFAALTLGLFPTLLSASTIQIDFGVPDAGFVQDVSKIANYTFAPGFSFTASGYSGDSATVAGTPTALHAKNLGGDEQGLGIASGTDFEITPGKFIQLNLTKLGQYNPTTTLQFGIDSSTGPDRYSLYLSNQQGIEGTFYKSGAAESAYSFTAAQIAATPFVSLTATAGNVLVGPGAITTATPEPGTLLSLSAGMLLVGWRFRKGVLNGGREA